MITKRVFKPTAPAQARAAFVFSGRRYAAGESFQTAGLVDVELIGLWKAELIDFVLDESPPAVVPVTKVERRVERRR